MIAGVVAVVYAFFTGFRYTYTNMHTVVEYLFILAGYFLLRFGIFDIIFNISAGQEIFFRGSTKLYDILMGKLGSWGWFIQFCCALPGIAFLMEWRYGINRNTKNDNEISSTEEELFNQILKDEREEMAHELAKLKCGKKQSKFNRK
jgi:hypothetical protein